MADPFAALRTPVMPVDPDPRFAARLRERIERGLALPKGMPAPALAAQTQPIQAAKIGALTPYLAAPRRGQGTGVSLRREVPDLDDVAQRAVARPPTDSPYGRGATIRDPFGHRWLLAGP